MLSLKSKINSKRKNIFSVLELGGSKVACAIARLEPSQDQLRPQFKLLGMAQQISKGFKSQAIIDMDALESSILGAVHTAEENAKETLSSVYVVIPSTTTKTFVVKSEIPLAGVEIEDYHLRRLFNLGRNNPVPPTFEVIHVLPKSYTLDTTTGIKDPRGMVGQILSVELVVIAAPKSLLRNLHLVVGRCHLGIDAFVVDAYASSLSCLIEDEMELGVTVVDIGGSSMSIACFCEGFLVHTDSIALGGNNITYDVARGLSTTLIQAERLKTLYGTVITCSSDEREMIYVPQIGEDVSPYTHQIPKTQLTYIIKSRVDEMIELFVKAFLNKNVDPRVFEKFVITGGGSLLPGTRELFAQNLKKSVRVGAPSSNFIDSEVAQTPMFSSLCGGLYYEWKEYIGQQVPIGEHYSSGNLIKNVFNWIKENF